MLEDWRKCPLMAEIAYYESLDLSVGIVAPCPVCGLIMVDVGNDRHDLICPECGILG